MNFLYRKILSLTPILAAFIFTALPLHAGVEVNGWEICSDARNITDPATCQSWTPVELPATIRAEADKDGQIRSFWFRGSFDLKGDISGFQGISFGRIGLGKTLYINGRCVEKGSFGASTYLPLPAHYHIQEELLHQGKNEITFRIDGYAGHYIELHGPATVQDETEFELTRFLNNILYIHAPVGIASVCLGFALALMLYFFLTRREYIYVFSSLALLLVATRIILCYLPFALAPYGVCYALDWAILPLFMALLFMLVQSIYRSYFFIVNVLVVPFLTGLSVLIFLENRKIFGLSLRSLMFMAVFVFLAPLFVMLLRRLHFLQKNRLRYLVSILCLGSASLLAAADIVSEITGWSASNILFIYASPLFIVFVAVLFGRERRLRNQELDQLYVNLRQTHDKEQTFTESSEEKLKRVIAFIDENYHSDISREGLAAAVDLNANYMGSLFKSYTGKRISEYINESRIREAAERLKQGDEKIITIALSVGFESLATFNRAFKALMGVTPSDYRAKKS